MSDMKEKAASKKALVDAVERLAEIYKSSGADEMELECEGMLLRLSKNPQQVQIQVPQPAYANVNPAAQAAPAPAATAAPTVAPTAAPAAASAIAPAAAPAAAPKADTATEVAPQAAPQFADPSLTQVKAPLVGTFYAAPAPDAEPFVTVGKRVQEGDVLCIIEAMKFMNEITAPCSGIIDSIEVANEQAVSFDEVIMAIRK